MQDDEDDRDGTPVTNNDDSEVPTCTEHATMSSAIADVSKNTDPDKSLQELPEYDNLDEDESIFTSYLQDCKKIAYS